MKTVLLLVCSNIFMTLAWYGHLKFRFLADKSLLTVILVSWAIAFFEYCLMVPANRLGYLSGSFSGYELKIIQEAITLGVFVIFAALFLKERLSWNYAVSFVLILLAVYFATAFKSGTGPASGS
jgi:uncharacterized protein (DUF486 family)